MDGKCCPCLLCGYYILRMEQVQIILVEIGFLEPEFKCWVQKFKTIGCFVDYVLIDQNVLVLAHVSGSAQFIFLHCFRSGQLLGPFTYSL